MKVRAGLVVAAVIAASAVAGCSLGSQDVASPSVVTAGDAGQGRRMIERYGCGACHTIPGVAGAHAKVGPPLTDFGERSFVAGQLANTPDNLARWIMDPQGVEPGTAMPDLGVTDQDAQDIVAYLEGL